MARHFNDYISAYLDYAGVNESPIPFHWWSVASIISGVLGRRCYMDRGCYTLYPNMYIVLVAESALCRKSSAVGRAESLLEYTKTDIVREKLTLAYLYRHLADTFKSTGEASVFIYAPELSTFLGKDAHQTGLVANLTSLYDCPQKGENRTKNAGIDLIPTPCLNILGATTLDWMSTNMPGETVEGGFTSRVIFVVEKEPEKRIAWPDGGKEQTSLKERLLEDLIEINNLQGPFTVEPEAKEVFTAYYMKMKEPEDPRLRGFFGRKGDHILKLSMVLSVSQSNSLIVTGRHVERAIQALNYVEQRMPLAFRGVAYSKTAKDVDRILGQLQSYGGPVKHSTLLRKNGCYLNAKEFAEVIRTLEESGRLEVRVSTVKGRAVRHYVLLEDKDVGNKA